MLDVVFASYQSELNIGNSIQNIADYFLIGSLGETQTKHAHTSRRSGKKRIWAIQLPTQLRKYINAATRLRRAVD